MTESETARLTVLEARFEALLEANEKRERVEDARHAEIVALVKGLTSQSEYLRGVKDGTTGAAKAFWAVLGGLVTGGILYLWKGH